MNKNRDISNLHAKFSHFSHKISHESHNILYNKLKYKIYN